MPVVGRLLSSPSRMATEQAGRATLSEHRIELSMVGRWRLHVDKKKRAAGRVGHAASRLPHLQPITASSKGFKDPMFTQGWRRHRSETSNRWKRRYNGVDDMDAMHDTDHALPSAMNSPRTKSFNAVEIYSNCSDSIDDCAWLERGESDE
ncbi:hypothetical protein GW17_00060970 [Ensete ventricosum]|nr:hypothetical protein GW17_00060970 [Ensete ventricosum]